ncbi:hypothetical protein OAM75_02180, partial [Gammaproteobacteria bacterium]|nr:hypothetical protein [Gammaproteobacteria bacterium]
DIFALDEQFSELVNAAAEYIADQRRFYLIGFGVGVGDFRVRATIREAEGYGNVVAVSPITGSSNCVSVWLYRVN